jgi:hypothetical protein
LRVRAERERREPQARRHRAAEYPGSRDRPQPPHGSQRERALDHERHEHQRAVADELRMAAQDQRGQRERQAERGRVDGARRRRAQLRVRGE